MQTWEMMKKLTDNPNKKFQRKSDGFKAYCDDLNCTNLGRTALFINDEWEEVKQPVDFMTAFNAWWKDNKTISYELDGSKYTINTKSDVKFYPREIMYAKWFIE